MLPDDECVGKEEPISYFLTFLVEFKISSYHNMNTIQKTPRDISASPLVK